jgi:hypothetical protein
MTKGVGMSDYFSDREFGSRPRTSETIEPGVWAALVSLIDTRIDDGSFGHRFPSACSDSPTIGCGTDAKAFQLRLAGEIPDLEWPLDPYMVPTTVTVLDFLEFCAKAVGEPIRGAWHDYMRHYHLSWERQAGLAKFVTDVNLLFSRNGVAFELNPSGQAHRLLPEHLGHTLATSNFRTGETHTDALLEDARRRFLAPRHEDRRDGLEKLWDAFERIKTLEGIDKRVSADVLLDRAARPGSRLRAVLANEARALTEIGNSHRIRHSELSQEPLEASEQVDYMFLRLFAFIHLLLSASGRLG